MMLGRLFAGTVCLLSLAFPSLGADDTAPIVPPNKGKTETLALFDGKSLAGWEGHPDLWSVKSGVIAGRNTKPVAVSTYLLTKRSFSDFQLIFSARLVESDMHSGIAFWGEVSPARGDKYTYKGHLVMFPSGWGLWELYGRGGLKADAAPAKKAGKQRDWNDMEIFAQGNRIRHVVNGVLVVDWRDPEPERIKDGPIGLQLHANSVAQEVQFKGLKLITFPDDTRLEGKKVGDKIDPPK